MLERPYEQIKIDFAYLGIGGVFVIIGASFDMASRGKTHKTPGDVGLLKLLTEFYIHVPGHVDEATTLLDAPAERVGRVYIRLLEDSNRESRPAEPRKFNVER